MLSAAKPRVGTYRAYVFSVARRIYTAAVFMLPGAELDPEVDRFFDSLVVTDAGGAELHRPPAPPPVKADLGDVYLTMTEQSPPGTFRTLLVHQDGVVELVTGRDGQGPVVRRTAKGVARVTSLKQVFENAGWRGLSSRAADAGPSFTYEIAIAGRAVQRSDPLSSVEPAFRKALDELGPLWMYAERAERAERPRPTP